MLLNDFYQIHSIFACSPSLENLQVRNGGEVIKMRPHIEVPIDNRKKRETREMPKRRTLDEYLCEGSINFRESLCLFISRYG